MDARSQHDEHDTMAPAAMVEQLLTEIAPTTTPRKGRNLPGVGTIYRRGRVWWIKYSVHGKRLRESSKSTRESDAIRLLRTRIEECGKGRRRDPVAESRVRMSELFAALVADYQENGRRSAATLAFRLAPLREAFGQDRALDVTTARIVRYRQDRLATGKAPATVNRELAALRRGVLARCRAGAAVDRAAHPAARGEQRPGGLHDTGRLHARHRRAAAHEGRPRRHARGPGVVLLPRRLAAQ